MIASVAATAAMIVSLAGTAGAQEEGPTIRPTHLLDAGRAVVRTSVEMARDEAARVAPTIPRDAFINRPMMDLAAYRAAKEAAARAGSTTKPVEPDLPPVLKGKNFNGVNQNQAGGAAPPDTHGAAGPSHFFEITNQHVDIYDKATKARVNGGGNGVSLASFFGYFDTALFDPRVIFDLGENRWVVTAEAFPLSGIVQPYFVAVSMTSDPLGGYFICGFDVDLNNDGSFFDYPQLGEDKGAVLATANRFGGSTPGSDVLGFPKADIYSGTCNAYIFLGNPFGTLAPPIVLDNSANSFIIGAPAVSPSFNRIKQYKLTKSGNPATVTLTGPSNIPIPVYSVPPDADQPAPCTGAANRLDTIDARFDNASTQIGQFLFNVHSIADGARAANRWYQINTMTKTVVRQDLFFASATSDDFNPSIAANEQLDVFLTWSSVNAGAGTNAQVRFSGREAADPPDISAGSAAFTSSSCLSGNFDPNKGKQRWGDYSAVTLDPTNHDVAWLVNEYVKSANVWATRITRIGF